MSTFRSASFLDLALGAIDDARGAGYAEPVQPNRAHPAAGIPVPELGASERDDVAGLMRINHTGEVCAQALYKGQAAMAKDPATRAQLLQAAQEEQDHLSWCADRLRELDAPPSLLNPLWYLGSYAIGATAAAVSDRISLGFVVETERQVEAHLQSHLERLPVQDDRSRAILSTMQAEEIEHADHALASGAMALPQPVRRLMGQMADVMRFLAYRV
ncbi:demethoxyubiquinone hydroxylase family protein [Ahniella affigens]|uniref:3-demethoxyubiquinol 3-hydroxylase n=1 Tax=Ahniella affigens TaxID=2021234 RepID=A0A2P1PW25_9GAMM|nr:2-polyprenyl-3-methyl-6-methoxy-1,4-benzoquinone monooxygenase [Ahniella affigens]AVP99043.1 demethoxyubiquinone hydroxylase family protein [Ahniella affigens]